MFYNTFFVKKIWWYKKKVVTLRDFLHNCVCTIRVEIRVRTLSFVN